MSRLGAGVVPQHFVHKQGLNTRKIFLHNAVNSLSVLPQLIFKNTQSKFKSMQFDAQRKATCVRISYQENLKSNDTSNLGFMLRVGALIKVSLTLAIYIKTFGKCHVLRELSKTRLHT